MVSTRVAAFRGHWLCSVIAAALRDGRASPCTAFLPNASYVLRYMIRRMFRVAKYAAIGGAIAFVGTGVLGALGTGIAWFAAPSMGMGVGMGITWAIIKVGGPGAVAWKWPLAWRWQEKWVASVDRRTGGIGGLAAHVAQLKGHHSPPRLPQFACH